MIKFIIIGFIWSWAMIQGCMGQSLNDLVGAGPTAPTAQNGAGGTPPASVATTVTVPANPKPFSNAYNLVPINREVIFTLVKDAMAQNIDQETSFKLDALPDNASCLKALSEPEIGILTLNEQQTKFSGEVKFCEDGDAKPIMISGTLELMTTIPVLSRAIHFGETIEEKDITTIQLPTRKINKSVITQVSDLIGTQPRNTSLRPQVAISRQQVVRPHDVKKDSFVVISYIKPHMVLTTKGKAMQDGYRGETIRVENIDSQKVIKATIEGVGHVFVDAMPEYLGKAKELESTPSPDQELIKEIKNDH